MSNELKITFVGGSEQLGDARSLELDGSLLVGRSHKAAIRFTEKDRDVSGVHLEIRKEADGVFAVAIKEFVLNERDTVPCGELRKLAKGDVLTLGPRSRAGIRIDALPTGDEAHVSEDRPTGETRFTTVTGATRMSLTSATGLTDAAATGATVFAGGETQATRFAETEAATSDRPTGDPKTGDGETEVLDPSKLRELSGVPDAAQENLDRTTGASDETTSDGVTTDGVTTGSGFGKTIALPQNAGQTVVIDPGLIPSIDPDAPKRFRKRLMVFAIFGFAAILGAVIYSRMNHSDRYLVHPGFVVSSFKDANGLVELQVDYPWESGSRKDETPTSLKVMSLTGKDRDCPFNLDFSISKDPSQVKLSLEDAAAREVSSLSGKGYSFSASEDDGAVSPEERAGFFFYEDQYPLRCQKWLPRGTRFFRREYTVARNGRNWWGVYIFLRDEDRVYRLFREIPENQKPRGKYLLLYNSNLSIFATFLDRRWESEGINGDERAENVKLGDLMGEVKQLVDGKWAKDWGAISQKLNLMMVATYGKPATERKPVREMLEEFRQRQDQLWRDFENERDMAIRNGDAKGLKSVCEQCRATFGKDKGDWRFKRSNNAKEWPWEVKSRRP